MTSPDVGPETAKYSAHTYRGTEICGLIKHLSPWWLFNWFLKKRPRICVQQILSTHSQAPSKMIDYSERGWSTPSQSVRALCCAVRNRKACPTCWIKTAQHLRRSLHFTSPPMWQPCRKEDTQHDPRRHASRITDRQPHRGIFFFCNAVRLNNIAATLHLIFILFFSVNEAITTVQERRWLTREDFIEAGRAAFAPCSRPFSPWRFLSFFLRRQLLLFQLWLTTSYGLSCVFVSRLGSSISPHALTGAWNTKQCVIFQPILTSRFLQASLSFHLNPSSFNRLHCLVLWRLILFLPNLF